MTADQAAAVFDLALVPTCIVCGVHPGADDEEGYLPQLGDDWTTGEIAAAYEWTDGAQGLICHADSPDHTQARDDASFAAALTHIPQLW